MDTDTTGAAGASGTAGATDEADSAGDGATEGATEGAKGAGTGNGRTGIKLTAVVALTVALLAGLWKLGVLDDAPKPAGKPVECVEPRPTDPPGYPAMCAALNRPDLPALLGTPDDHVSTAHPAPLALGKDVMVEVRLMRTVVTLMDDSPSVEDMLGMPQFFAKPTTLLGHPAATYSSSTMVLAPGGKAGPGTRNLVVAQDPKAPGGRAVEIAVFRQDGQAPDDAALARVAETVMPTLPGWVAAP
ncbi:DUF6215 domain-containing protein [Streptomyces sp. NRRL S-350]|uniref:DUF6215 domain-containing protein n=1 Tax=Streptomyces sp. NRRL S-350 TaxID=1463902 RepID=UPI00068E1A83|nr:DUF6215 domain-containing protein [Streptomyces sp. NRRL S-350]